MKQNPAVQNADKSNRKYVFVCGLPRSGTTILGRNIARMENCTGLRDTGVLGNGGPNDKASGCSVSTCFNEGRFLQDVYPTEDVAGGPGRFGFDPRTHLTEHSDLLTTENVTKLRAGWHAHWDNSRSIFVEKTPANILMTRFLQAAFPNSYFIVITRHPIPVSIAAQKWKKNVTSLYSMFEHWLHCHSIYERDKKHLKRVYELRYEDYVQNQAKHHEEIAAFLGTCVPEPPKEDNFRTVIQWPDPFGLRVPELAMERTSGAYNRKYFDHWSDLLNNSPFKRYYQYIAAKYEPRFAKYGYSLTKGFGVREAHLHKLGKTSATVGALYCLIADVCAFVVRLAVYFKGRIMRQIRARLPEVLKIRIKHLLQRIHVSRKRPRLISS